MVTNGKSDYFSGTGQRESKYLTMDRLSMQTLARGGNCLFSYLSTLLEDEKGQHIRLKQKM
jgi:hypothetical protein